MREILGKAKTVRELLKGVKYSTDYYKREYKWHEKQIRELVEDLSDKFLEEYQPGHARAKVDDYSHYFPGSIINSKKESVGYIVDGQQRLTSLTLLLVLLRNLQKDRDDKVNVDELIFSEKYAQRSFNLHVDERTPAMEALHEGQPFDLTDRPESVQNLVQRYRDLETLLPEELRGDALPYFVDWLLENVHLLEITAYSDDDAYSTMQYAIFVVMRDIRGLDLQALSQKLYDSLMSQEETFASNDRLYVHQQNRYALHRILARLTDYVETQSGQPSRYLEYVGEGKARYEVEHIWANHAEQHSDEFSHPTDFADYRNRIGGLLLLPKSFNASYGDLPYADKLPHYNAQNLLARSLHPQSYKHNPGFLRFKEESALPFTAAADFKKTDLDQRGELYRSIAERIWNPKDLLGGQS